MSIRLTRLIVLYILTDYLCVLSLTEKSWFPNILVDLSVSLFSSIRFPSTHLMCFEAVLLSTHT